MDSLQESKANKHQFLTSLDLEYRLYSWFFSTPYDRFFISIWGKIGYGKKIYRMNEGKLSEVEPDSSNGTS